MNQKSLHLAALALAATGLPALAQVSLAGSTTEPTDTRTFEEFLNDIKKPLPWLSWGADLRTRNEYLHRAITLTENNALHQQDVVRFRARLWTTIAPSTNLVFNARLAAEPRLWINDAFAGTYRGRTGMEWRYGILDLLNVKWSNVLDQPLTVSAGRQEILLGDYYDWWLVADGTPSDGSWTLSFDSARLTYELPEVKTKLDLIFIQQNARPDEFLPTLQAHPDGYQLTEQNERGLVAYVSNKSIQNLQADGYFIYKHDEREFANGDNADIYTVGGKLTGTPIPNWSYSLEGAYQFGWKEDRIGGVLANRDLDAYGAKAKLAYSFDDALKNQISLGGELLSGDNPNTPEDEMFDLLWGRWPRWSELYIYSYVNETGGRIAQMNNLLRFGPTWSMVPSKGMNVGMTYNALFAPQETPTRTISNTLFSNDSHFRGHYLQVFVKHQFSKHLQAHLWWETVWEEDFYAQQNAMTFLRGEIMLTF